MRNKRMLRSCTAAVALYAGLGVLVCPHTAAAQSDPGTKGQTVSAQNAAANDGGSSIGALEEIVVTAQRRPESSQTVPVSITLLNAAQIESLHIETLSDLGLAVPGLAFETEGIDVVPFIRGVGNNSTGAGNESPVATFVDGVYIGSQSSAQMALNNVASIEVDKGPQGTLFGRNATGGVIQITTKTPQNTPQADINVGYGNYGTTKATLYATAGVAPGLAANLSIAYRDQTKGWGKNLYNGSEANLDHFAAVSSKWRWDASENTVVTLIGDYSRIYTDKGTDFGMAPGDQWRLTPTSPIYGNVGFYNTNSNFPSYLINSNWGFSGQVTHDMGWANFISISAYRVANAHQSIDADTVPASVIEALIAVHEVSASQEFRLSSDPDSSSRLEWQAGAFFYYNHGGEPLLQISGSDSVFRIPQVTSGTLMTHSYAGYAHATYALLPDTKLLAGIRYTRDLRSVNGSSCGGPSQLLGPTPGVPVCSYWTNGIGGPVGAWSTTQSKPTWDIGLNHNFTSDVMAYVKYSTGFKSGLFNINSISTPAIEPETISAYEVGMKSAWLDHRLRLNAAGFYYNYNNLQVQQYSNGQFTASNAASSKIKGVDLDLTAVPFKNLSVDASFEYLDAHYSDYQGGPSYARLPITTPNGPPLLPGNLPIFGYGGYAQSPQDLSGNAMILAPRVTASLSATYRIPTAVGQFELTSSAIHKQKFYFDASNIEVQPAYTAVNSSLKWTDLKGKWDVKLWVENLTDQKIINGLNPTTTGANLGPAAPRTFGVELGAKF